MTAKYDVVGIGNALVDIITNIEDQFLEEQGLPKGSMNLVDLNQSNGLYDQLPAGKEFSGGSAGNTMAGIAELGGKGAFIGKVRDDQFGDVFAHDLKALGVDFPTTRAIEGENTGKCLVMVSPDAERTMATYLGAGVSLSSADITADVIAHAKVIYMEGYLFDPDHAKEAFIKAAHIAHDSGREVSLSLSDSFCVDRHRDAFRDLVEYHVDILFANEDEIKSLYETEHFDEALQIVKEKCKLACLTRGEHGSVIVAGEETHLIDAIKVGHVIDTTGAGDQYAAGFLYGYTQGYSLFTSGQIASAMASEVISHYGARPQSDLESLIAPFIAA